MKFRILVCASAAAAFGLVSVGFSRSVSPGSQRVATEQLLLQQATALTLENRFEDAWQMLILPTSRGESGAIASLAKLGWRVASVAGALRNRSDYAAADAFARYALMQPWTEPGRALSRADVGDAGYWCAWLASEILADRISALEWIEEASRADPESKRVSELKERLSEAERSFPTR